MNRTEPNNSSAKSRARSYFAPRVNLPPIPVALSAFARLGIALLAVVIATILKMRLEPVFGDSAPFLLYFGAVAISAWLGGLSAGLLATLLSALAQIGVFSTLDFNTKVAAQTALFVIESCAISYLIQVTRRSQEQSAMRAQELQTSEDRYRQVLDTAYEGIWILDSQGTTTYVNEHMATMIGYSREEMQGAPVFDFISAEARQAALDNLEKRSKGIREQYEFLLQHKNGDHVWVLVSSTPLRDEKTKFVGSLAMLTDISPQKRIEAALRQSEERYRAFVSQSSEAIWRFELDKPLDATISLDAQMQHCIEHTYVAECNDVMAQMYGLQRAEQLIGKRLHEILSYNNDNASYMTEFLTRGYHLKNAASKRTDKNGQTRYFLTDLIGICENGALQRVWGMRRDVTAQKEIEMQRASLLAREHEARVAAELAREEAQSASRAKDEFLATLSHELRTPLNSILGWSQLLGENKLDAEATNYALDAIARNARLQAQLVEDLLDVSRITMGRMHIEREPVIFAEVVRAAIQTVHPNARERQIEIEYSNECDESTLIVGDAPRLQQVLWNLISNAIKFTSRNGRICVSQSCDENWIKLEISDNGKGIEPQFLPHVFEAFRQADSSSTRSHGGVGLGLSIVKTIVELHDGTIEVQSDGEGCGATFIVKLPLPSSSAK